MSDARDTIIEDILQAKFDPADHKTFKGRGGFPMTYIEDETVMDRLDFALGFGGWQVTEATPINDRCVRLTIGTKHPATGEWTYYTDFGYQTNADSEEPFKEAWTDAFRRVARIPGVARYVYAGEAPAPAGATQSAPAPQVAQVSTTIERPPLPPNTVPYQDRNAEGGDSCPAGHGAWTVQPGGTVKSGPRQGQAYDPFWKCAGKGPNNSFCKEKPSKAWVDAHPIAS